MKQFLSADAEHAGGINRSRAARIAERYGIPESEVEALIGGKQPSSDAESAPHPLTIGALMQNESQTTMASNNNESQSKWSPVATLGMILGILGVLSLVVAILLIARWRSHSDHHTVHQYPPPPQMMTPPSAPASADTAAPLIEEPKQTEQPAVKPPAKPKARRTASASSGFSTSSNMEAQERLAEMRAAGNNKAQIRTITKNGVTLYQVR